MAFNNNPLILFIQILVCKDDTRQGGMRRDGTGRNVVDVPSKGNTPVRAQRGFAVLHKGHKRAVKEGVIYSCLLMAPAYHVMTQFLFSAGEKEKRRLYERNTPRRWCGKPGNTTNNSSICLPHAGL